jgi:hypothetical protein
VLAGKDQSKNAKPMFGSAITILSSRGYERRSDRQPLCLRVTTSFRGSWLFSDHEGSVPAVSAKGTS